MAKPMKPVVEGPLWHIGTRPALGELETDKQQVVDHAIFQAANGKWQLWACVRFTQVGRLLYRWEGDALTEGPWRPCGVAMRAEQALGESINERDGKEWIQAPYVHIEDGRYYMFYGGHNTELGEAQICLATSTDGLAFKKHRQPNGFSRLFVGPGVARDPMVIKVGSTYLCYYAGNERDRRAPCKVYCRESTDLYTWSEPRVVSWGGAAGYGPCATECPFVVHKDGFFYLFHTSEYNPPAVTHVYRSADPYDFGCDSDEKLVATLRVAAPEVVCHQGEYYISTVEDLTGGVQLGRLRWVDD